MQAAVLCVHVCVCTVQTGKGVCVLEGVIFFLFPQSQAGARSSHLPPQHDPALVTQPLSQETQRSPLVSLSAFWTDTSTA